MHIFNFRNTIYFFKTSEDSPLNSTLVVKVLFNYNKRIMSYDRANLGN